MFHLENAKLFAVQDELPSRVLCVSTLRLYPIPNVRHAVGDSNTLTRNRSRRKGRPPDECISGAWGASGGGPPPCIRFLSSIQQVKHPCKVVK